MRSDRFVPYIVAICMIVLFCLWYDKPSLNESDRTKLNEEYKKTLELARQIESEIRGSDQGEIPSHVHESHFHPPPPPAGGIDALLEGIANEVVFEARVIEYVLMYYPLVALEDDVVSQLDNQQRAEYKRQNDALDKELLGSGYTLVKKVESHLGVPMTVLNILRKE